MVSPPPTILLCDDDEGVMSVTALVLQREGYRVVEAHDAEDAMAKATSLSSLSLLITDLMLPGIAGDQLARMLRANHSCLRVLLVTGYASDKPSQQFDAMTRLLEKPFTPDVLLHHVRELLGESRHDRDGAEQE